MADILNPACVGRTINVSSPCGCTLTAATITGFTPADIVALGNSENNLTRTILAAGEAKMLGVPERNLMTLLNSNIREIGKKQLTIHNIDGQSIIQPFIMRGQRSFINANYWTILAGTPAAGAGVGAVPAAAWQVTVGLGNSVIQTTLEAIERFFTVGSTIIVKTWDNVATKTALTHVFTIYSAVNADAGDVKKATLVIYPNINNTDWTAMSASEKQSYQPTFGMVQNGTNSTNDRESYCPQQPSDLSKRLIVNWLQTSRESYCREQSYEEVIDAILAGKVNDYLRGFKTLSIQDQQKQQKARYEMERMNSAMYGQAIDVNEQTTANWRNLPIVYDIVDTDCPLAYKASALGIFTLLSDCNRVIDMNGNRLDLDDIFERIYWLRRWREASGDRVPIIDSMTDRFTSASIFEAMTKYYTARYGWETTRFAKINEKITHDGIIMFTYNIYDVPDSATQWAVFVDDYFNDQVDAANTRWVGWEASTRVNELWFLDWSDIWKGIAGHRQVSRKTPNSNTDLAIWQCVIDPNVKSYDMRSETWTMMVDHPERHLIIHNFAAGCPRVTIPGCTVPQS